MVTLQPERHLGIYICVYTSINLKLGLEIFWIQKYFKIMKTDSDKCQESCVKTGLETLRGHMATAAAATSYN